MNASTIPRPTENAVIGSVRRRPLPPVASIRDSLAGAKQRADRYGAILLSAMLTRATTLGQVGE